MTASPARLPANASARTASSAALSSPFARNLSTQDSLWSHRKVGGRKGSKWGILREAVLDGRVRLLPSAKEYSIVSSTFLKLFPDSFDRAVPVIRHKEVDELLTQLDLCMWDFQRADTYRNKMGRRPEGRLSLWGLWGPKVDLIRHYRGRMIEIQHKIREARRDAQMRGGGTPSWFVFFKT